VRKTGAIAASAGLLAVVVTLAGIIGACSAPFVGKDSGSPSPQGSAIQRILGHAPTGAAAKIAAKGQISIANDADYPPQSYMEDGKLVGFDVDVGKRVAELLDVQARFVNPNWNAVPAGLEAGKFDVAIGSMTEASAPGEGLAFGDPYYYQQAQLVVAKGAPLLATAADLKGKAIGCALATTYQDYLTAVGGVDVTTYDTSTQALAALARGHLDGVLADDLTANRAIADGKAVQLSGQPLFYEPVFFAVRKGEGDLLTVLDRVMKTMRKDGSLSALSRSWYEGYDATKTPGAGVPTFAQAIAQPTSQ
jgi:ABC-type amino acid transport substrate-binding protein